MCWTHSEPLTANEHARHERESQMDKPFVHANAVPGLATRIATRQMITAAPLFSVRKLDGTVVNSAEFRGSVVVLDYWATWCPACRREMPDLEKLPTIRGKLAGQFLGRGCAGWRGDPGEGPSLYAERGLHSADCLGRQDVQRRTTQTGKSPFTGDYGHRREGNV